MKWMKGLKLIGKDLKTIRNKEIVRWRNGRRSVSTPKETYRMEELGGHTTNVSSGRLFL